MSILFFVKHFMKFSALALNIQTQDRHTWRQPWGCCQHFCFQISIVAQGPPKSNTMHFQMYLTLWIISKLQHFNQTQIWNICAVLKEITVKDMVQKSWSLQLNMAWHGPISSVLKDSLFKYLSSSSVQEHRGVKCNHWLQTIKVVCKHGYLTY